MTDYDLPVQIVVKSSKYYVKAGDTPSDIHKRMPKVELWHVQVNLRLQICRSTFVLQPWQCRPLESHQRLVNEPKDKDRKERDLVEFSTRDKECEEQLSVRMCINYIFLLDLNKYLNVCQFHENDFPWIQTCHNYNYYRLTVSYTCSWKYMVVLLKGRKPQLI